MCSVRVQGGSVTVIPGAEMALQSALLPRNTHVAFKLCSPPRALVLGAGDCRKFMDMVVSLAGLRHSGSHCLRHHEHIVLRRYLGPPCDKSRRRAVATGRTTRDRSELPGHFTDIKGIMCVREGGTERMRRYSGKLSIGGMRKTRITNTLG